MSPVQAIRVTMVIVCCMTFLVTFTCIMSIRGRTSFVHLVVVVEKTFIKGYVFCKVGGVWRMEALYWLAVRNAVYQNN